MIVRVYNKKLSYVDLECPEKCTLSWLKSNCKLSVYHNKNSFTMRWYRQVKHQGEYFVQQCYKVTIPLKQAKYKPRFRRVDYLQGDV